MLMVKVEKESTGTSKYDKYKLFNAGIAQLVEHDLAKVGVASSSLVSRSSLPLLSILHRSSFGAGLNRLLEQALIIVSRLDGRVAMQWTATPRTPVRFRLQPPFMQ